MKQEAQKQVEKTKQSEKRQYVRPQLTQHGCVEQLTQAISQAF